jgi:hypothetical protein
MKNKSITMHSGISYIVDSRGRETSMVIDLKNKTMKAWAEKIKEDIEDREMINQIRNDPTNERINFFEAADAILADKKILTNV